MAVVAAAIVVPDAAVTVVVDIRLEQMPHSLAQFSCIQSMARVSLLKHSFWATKLGQYVS